MNILGVNKGLNSSAVLMRDHEVVFAVQEERLSREKCHAGFPHLSIDAALRHAGLKGEDIDLTCVSETSPKVADSRERDLRKYDERYEEIKRAWFGESECPFCVFARRMKRKFHAAFIENAATSALSVESHLARHGLRDRHVTFDHHLSHAAAAYYGLAPNDGEPCLIFSLDGGGDGRTSAVFLGQDGELKELASSDSFSPACLYAHVTYLMGFRPHEHEHKLMALAPYVAEEKTTPIRERLARFIGFDPQNPLTFNNTDQYPDLTISHGADAVKRQLAEDLLKTTLNVPFDALAGGLQSLVEDLAIRWVKAGIEQTGARRILLCGGFFMNVKVNRLIAESPEVDWINCFPSCGDESAAFGAAFMGWRSHRPTGSAESHFTTCRLGPNIAEDLDEARERFADQASFEKLEDPNEEAARLLSEGKLVARCSGRLEFGARALGNRSILAPLDDLGVVHPLGSIVKRRDFWTPFAPAVLRERAEELLEIPKSLTASGSPYMMFAFKVKPDQAKTIAAGVHQADQTARAQLVDPETTPDFHDLIVKYHERTGCPAVLNTSFNQHGQPIVATATQAVELFLKTPLDALILDDYLVLRRNSETVN